MKDTRQWEFVADMNSDGVVTVSDIGPWFEWLGQQIAYYFMYSGNWVVSILTDTSFGIFFEIDTGGLFAFLISIPANFAILILIFLFAGLLIAIVNYPIVTLKEWYFSILNCIKSLRVGLNKKNIRCQVGFISLFLLLLFLFTAQLIFFWLFIASIIVSYLSSWIK